jgi:hypothetical protein
MTDEEFDLFRDSRAQYGLSQDDMFSEIMRVFAEFGEKVSSLHKERIKSEKRKIERQILSEIARNYLRYGNPEDHAALMRECDIYGYVLNDILDDAEISPEVEEIMNSLSNMNETETAILQVMSEVGQKYSKQYVVDNVCKIVKTSDSSISRAKKRLGIQHERRKVKGKIEFVWFIPRKEDSTQEIDNNDEQLTMH